jgi:hypothetical protein
MGDTIEPAFDVRAILVRIDRDLMESAKLREESDKFIAEQKKLTAEEAKLRSEARKLDCDRWIAPLVGNHRPRRWSYDCRRCGLAIIALTAEKPRCGGAVKRNLPPRWQDFRSLFRPSRS